jgi:hypothetical protein
MQIHGYEIDCTRGLIGVENAAAWSSLRRSSRSNVGGKQEPKLCAPYAGGEAND